MLHFIEAHSQYAWFIGYALVFFVGYVLLDHFLLKIRRIGRNAFTAILISFSVIALNYRPLLGLVLFISAILFGDRFYYRYMVVHKPKEKEKLDGSVL